MRVLAIGAHPDDIEIHCGGLLWKLKAAKWDLHGLICAGCGYATDCASEAEQSAKIIGMDIDIYSETNLRVAHNDGLVSYMDDVMDNVAPDLVVSHWDGCYHQDHRAVGLATVSAMRRRKGILLQYNSRVNFKQMPSNVVVEIDVDKKLSLLKMFKSQHYRNGFLSVDGVEKFKLAGARL